MTQVIWDDGAGGSWLLPFLTVDVDESWKKDAACRGMGVEIFFPDPPGGQPDDGPRRAPEKGALERSKGPCQSCSVTAECRAYAKAIGTKDGTWGGQDELERRRRPRRRSEAS